jgi:hypothetical protein
MNPKLFWLITATLLISIHPAEAQQPKLRRIGYLASTGSAPPSPSGKHYGTLAMWKGKISRLSFRASGGKPERNADFGIGAG